ncbi:ATPase [Thiocystis violacea]|uniref:ATPase n=1 Tax=Thiocystis violacea TaxID=13725 RepID=UPI0019075204|nr:ATPase [Thiocystis violacea]MBK1718308.1 ATPase [Thiocystis violacea]
MKFTVEEFRAWKHKCVTLLGMSGVGKTYLSAMLRRSDWFHYSGDYRIGTRYLDEPILDLIKARAMRDTFLRELLRKDWITIRNIIKIHDLGPVLSFIGKLGNPELGGLPLDEFSRRQALYREAEIAAMLDLPEFVRKAQEIYSYAHLVNDVGGSLCELEEPRVIEMLAQHSLILYIRVPEADEIKLIQRAQADPKPLYYRPDFLQVAVKDYLELNRLSYVAEIDPDDFTRWVFPRLFHSRVPRYEAIARPHGYTVSSEDAARVRDERDFLELIETAIERSEAA